LGEEVGGLGLCPQWGSGAEPLVRESGGKTPPSRSGKLFVAISGTFLCFLGGIVIIRHPDVIHSYS